MILCTLHQWLWSCAYDEGRAVPVITRRHLTRCAGCREIVAAMCEVSAILVKEPVEPDDRWHADVMREVRRVEHPPSRPVIWPLPVSLAAAMVVAAVVFLRKEPLPIQPARETAVPVASSLVPVAGGVTCSLENEGAALEQDLQQAVQIATSCLPF